MEKRDGFYELLSTTNNSFLHYVGRKGTLDILTMMSGCFYFATGDRYLRSSVVVEETVEGDIITFKTLNSTYIFKYLGDSLSISELFGNN